MSFNPRLLIPIALILTVGLSGWYVDALRAKQRSTLSGFFESQPTEVSSRITGRVAQIVVHEGQTVTAGTTLLSMDAAPLQADTAAKQATAEQAHAQLRETLDGPRREEIRKQEGVVAEKAANLARLRNGPLPEEIAAARARLDQAIAADQKALAGSRPEEIAQARAAEKEAAARLAQSQRGQTADERAQVKARLDAALSQEALAKSDAERYDHLFQAEAVTRQQWDQAQANLREATARRQEAEAAWKQAEIGTPAEELEQARQDFAKAKAASDLVRAGTRREDREAASSAVAEARQNLMLLEHGTRLEEIVAAQAQLAQAQATLAELHAGNRQEEIAAAQAAARAAKETARSSVTNLAERIVRAPQDGVIERIPVAVGDLVNAGTTVVRLTNPQDIWLRVYVPEDSLSHVAVGASAAVRVDGISAPVVASVESIATQGEFTPANLQTPKERGMQVFGVRLRLTQPDPRIKPGMYATVTRIGSWEL